MTYAKNKIFMLRAIEYCSDLPHTPGALRHYVTPCPQRTYNLCFFIA